MTLVEQHDYTMSFESGSVTFSVEGVLFQIPKALLQQHSDAFSNMLGHEGNGEAVVLQDSADAFREFRAVMFTPFQSCVSRSHPSSSNLATVLQVLAIAHKYCATVIEKQAIEIALGLTHPSKIRSHIKPPLSIFQIWEISKTIGSKEISDPVRKIILEDLGADRSSLLEALTYGERLGDHEVVGQAYYKVLLLGRTVWSTQLDLPEIHRKNLIRGLVKLYEMWDRIERSWDRAHEEHPTCRPDPDYSPLVLRVIADSRLPSYDVLGRLRCIMSVSHSTRSCDRRIKAGFQSRIESITAHLYLIFTNPLLGE